MKALDSQTPNMPETKTVADGTRHETLEEGFKVAEAMIVEMDSNVEAFDTKSNNIEGKFSSMERKMDDLLLDSKNSTHNFYPNLPKMEFPRFNGQDPRGWIRKCNKFFQFNPMSEVNKVLFASFYFDETADHWFQSLSKTEGDICWAEFQEKICARFVDPVHEINLLGEFNKLQQIGSVAEYVDKFEELSAFILEKYKGLTEEYFVDSYISGLKEEIRYSVMVFNPSSLAHVFSLSRLQEAVLGAPNKNLLGGGEEEFEDSGMMTISLNALAGNENNRTIKLKGLVKNIPITMHVVHGSTHNFLDSSIAKKLGCKFDETDPFMATAANGTKIRSKAKCHEFQFTIQGHKFETEMRALHLEGCYVVLGVQWLQQLRSTSLDFKESTLSFNKDGLQVTLKGETGHPH